MIFKTFDSLLESGKKYDLLISDPPWKYDQDTVRLRGCASNRKCSNSYLTGYITMDIEDIKAMPVQNISERDSVMCMWTTGPQMNYAVALMEAWGFKYKTVLFVWEKTTENDMDRPTMASYTLPSTEFVLLGIRGRGIRIPPADKIHTIRQVQRAPVTGHSVKPPLFLRLIEQQFHCASSKLEMFARVGFPGWDLFGNEAEYQETVI